MRRAYVLNFLKGGTMAMALFLLGSLALVAHNLLQDLEPSRAESRAVAVSVVMAFIFALAEGAVEKFWQAE